MRAQTSEGLTDAEEQFKYHNFCERVKAGHQATISTLHQELVTQSPHQLESDQFDFTSSSSSLRFGGGFRLRVASFSLLRSRCRPSSNPASVR
jgi:hypothetical protein